VKLDPVLLEILVCPDCKSSLTVDNDNAELICNGCGLIYPVRDDIPVMLVDEARRAAPPEAEPPEQSEPERRELERPEPEGSESEQAAQSQPEASPRPEAPY
jgi:uncharacterized protein YbaR (Trm112 family)